VKILEGKTPRDVCIQYRDDENKFVNLSRDEDLIYASRCLRPVDNSEDFYRLSVRLHATATPLQFRLYMLELKDDRERAGKATMSFTSATKTAAVQVTLRVVFVKDLILCEGHHSICKPQRPKNVIT